MYIFTRLVVAASFALMTSTGSAQSDTLDDIEELKITALEVLMSAPPERALPLVSKVLAGESSDEVKERALFVLSQIDLPEAQSADSAHGRIHRALLCSAGRIRIVQYFAAAASGFLANYGQCVTVVGLHCGAERLRGPSVPFRFVDC